MGKFLIIVGVVIVGVGIVLHFFPNAFSWFGKLPGDIRIERENSVFYFPITTMIIISIVLSLVGLFLRK